MWQRSKSTSTQTRRFIESKIGPGYGKERRPSQSTKGEVGQNEGSKGGDSTHSGTKVLVSYLAEKIRNDPFIAVPRPLRHMISPHCEK